MASKRSESKPKPGRAAKRKPKQTLKDLQARNDRKIRGGEILVVKHTDGASNKLF